MENWIEQYWGIAPSFQLKLLYTLVATLLIIVIRFTILKYLLNSVTELKDRYTYTRTVKIIFGLVWLFSIITIWVSAFGSLATFLGLISAGLAIALKDLIVNTAGWLFIMTRRPFRIGDRIEIGNNQGDVIDIRIFQFTINEIGNWVDADQSTGRIIHIPNGKVFTQPQASYNQGFSHIWNEIGVLITFESDWEKAKGLLSEIVNKHATHLSKPAARKLMEASRKYMILYSKLTPIVYTSVKESGIMLTMRYLITPHRRRSSEEAIWEGVLKEFAQHKDIDLAYPTQRVFFNPQEGKQQAEPARKTKW